MMTISMTGRRQANDYNVWKAIKYNDSADTPTPLHTYKHKDETRENPARIWLEIGA